jgi:hypothetical protein
MPSEPANSVRVSQEHFRLLQEFGRNELQRRVSDTQREQMWEFACQSARLPVIQRKVVIEHWKIFIGGISNRSGIAINGDVDPKYTTIGITWENHIYAAHTTKTTSILKRVLEIFAKTFSDRETFLSAAEQLCRQTADRAFKKKRK